MNCVYFKKYNVPFGFKKHQLFTWKYKNITNYAPMDIQVILIQVKY